MADTPTCPCKTACCCLCCCSRKDEEECKKNCTVCKVCCEGDC